MLISLLSGEISQNEYINYNNIKIIQANLPKRIYGLIFYYKDINLIVINKYISKERAKTTLLHEFAHYELHHLDKICLDFKIEGIEDEADRYVNFLLEKELKEDESRF